MSDSNEPISIKMGLRKNNKDYLGLNYDESNDSLKEIKFDPCDPKKNFYRLIQFNTLGSCVRQGFKLFEIYDNEETLVKNCLCLLQSHSVFPVKIFNVEYQTDEMCKGRNRTIMKSLWLETRIEKTPESTSLLEEMETKKFQINIHKYFMQELIPRLEMFKSQLFQQELFYSEDDAEMILEKFNSQVLSDSNEKFMTYVNSNCTEEK